MGLSVALPNNPAFMKQEQTASRRRALEKALADERKENEGLKKMLSAANIEIGQLKSQLSASKAELTKALDKAKHMEAGKKP